MSDYKLTLLGAALAFGLAPQVVAQDSVILADVDNLEVILEAPAQVTTFTPLRDMGGATVQVAPEVGAVDEAGLPLPQSLPQGLPQPTPSETLTPAPMMPSPLGSPVMGNLMDAPIESLPSIADLVERVSQSTVNILTMTDSGETTSKGEGSGFIISDRKEVVTNYHVIEGGTQILIEFNDGRSYPAEIIGTDPETDLALLKFDAPETLPYVEFYDGEPIRIGDWVVAIGNPFGIGQSTSLGVISAIGREEVDSGSFVDYIQTDATINRGNSGGPLFNLNGDVVGVNSAIFSPTGASVGIAFVIPHYTAQEVISELQSEGRVRRGYLGAGLRTATFELDGEPGIYKSGATVNGVLDGSPAQIYGLQVDDIILRIGETPVRNSVEATRAIAAIKPGEVAKFIYERNEKTFALDVQIGERPEKYELAKANAESQGLPPPSPPEDASKPKVNIDVGLQLLDLSAEFRTAIGMRSDQVGVYVESVTPGSMAERGGFSMGMVLLDADNQPIEEVAKWKTIVLNAKSVNQDGIIVNVRLKDGQETFMVLPLL